MKIQNVTIEPMYGCPVAEPDIIDIKHEDVVLKLQAENLALRRENEGLKKIISVIATAAEITEAMKSEQT